MGGWRDEHRLIKVEFAILSFSSSVSVPSFYVISTYVRASFVRRRRHFPSASSCFRRRVVRGGVYPSTQPRPSAVQQIMLTSAARHVAALSGSSRSSARKSAAAAVGSHASFSSQSNDDDVYSEEGISHDGEWAGCTRRFLPPIKIAVRGSEILTNPLCECCAAGIPPAFSTFFAWLTWLLFLLNPAIWG